MTIKELSQLYWLKLEIKKDQERLDALRDRTENISSSLSGTGGINSGFQTPMIEKNIAEIIDLEAIISAKQLQCRHEQSRLERYISDIPDSYTRYLFTLRFIEGKSYPQIAKETQGISPDSARMTISRYIKGH